jgi:hypothetical protein
MQASDKEILPVAPKLPSALLARYHPELHPSLIKFHANLYAAATAKGILFSPDSIHATVELFSQKKAADFKYGDDCARSGLALAEAGNPMAWCFIAYGAWCQASATHSTYSSSQIQKAIAKLSTTPTKP